MLGVFGIAITPWSTFHHHEPIVETPAEKNCTHKFHVKTQQDTCLLCAAHFEKNYTAHSLSFQTYLQSEPITKIDFVVGSAFTALISTSLRGPPSFS